MQTIKQTLTRKDRGFTLIELLVVIAIIAVLAALILAALSSAQKGSRDSKRRSDLNQYRTGLVQYASDNNGTYPASPAANDATALAIPAYLSQNPTPPTSGGGNYAVYKYFQGANTAAMVLCTRLERTSNYLFVTTSTTNDQKGALCVIGDAE